MGLWRTLFRGKESFESNGADIVYTNRQYGFKIRFPAIWHKRPLLPEYVPEGGQIAITEPNKKATLNIAVGPFYNNKLREKETRAHSAETWLTKILPSRNPSIRYVDINVRTDKSVSGEDNCVEALYKEENGAIEGIRGNYRCALVSLYHNGLEYTIQWSAEEVHESSVQTILNSFQWI